MTQDIPRRSRLDLMTPAEGIIYNAVKVVERTGCDVRLTEAVVLLQKARDRVADFVDGVDPQPEHKGLACEDRCGTRLETWWCAACNAKHGRPPHLAQEVSKLVAHIKSLEDGIVAENRRTSEIERELEEERAETTELFKEYQIESDETLRDVVERLDAAAKRVGVLRTRAMQKDLDEAQQELETITSFLIGQGEYSLSSGVSVFVSVARILHERNMAQGGELTNIRTMLAETADDPPAEATRLAGTGETAAAVSALLSSNKNLANSLEAQSRALDAADERASTATDVLCSALGADHGRGGLVEHCQKAADLIARLKVRDSNLTFHTRNVMGVNQDLRAKLVEAERVRDAIADGERVTYAICENLRADQRATGDVLAGILGRERCGDGNVCLANDVSAWVERSQVLMHNLNRDFTTLAALNKSNADELARELAHAALIECERAIKQRDESLRTGLLTAEGGTHETCFKHVFKQVFKDFSSSGAAQAGVAQRGQSNEGTHGSLDRPAPPEPAGDWKRDRDWVLAMAQALGTNSGFNVPITPDVEAFRKLFDDVHRVFGGLMDADEVADLQQGAKAAMGQLIMRSDLVAACKRAGLTGLVAELEREP